MEAEVEEGAEEDEVAVAVEAVAEEEAGHEVVDKEDAGVISR